VLFPPSSSSSSSGARAASVEADLAEVVELVGRGGSTVVVTVVEISLDLRSQIQLQSSHSLFQQVALTESKRSRDHTIFLRLPVGSYIQE